MANSQYRSHSQQTHRYLHTHISTDVKQINIFIALVLNLGITAIEFIGGALSGSLALTSDAFHNLGDTISVFNSWIAFRISRRQSTSHQTFGYKRIEVLSALLNALLLVGISIYVLIEAYDRLLNPHTINSNLMLGVGVIGLLGNLFSVLLLHRDAKKNINVRSSYLHLMGDLFSSIAVIVGAILMRLYNIVGVDAILSIGIVLVILYNAVKIIYETTDILMQGAPRHVNVEKMKAELENLPMVKNIHHLHIWRLSDTQWHFECHVSLEADILISETSPIRHEISRIVKERYHFSHVTLQLEFDEGKKAEVIDKSCR